MTEAVEFRVRKWDGTPHWVHQEVLLGQDDLGTWLGQPVGWGSERPGRSFRAHSPNVTLLIPGADFIPTFWDARGADRIGIYVDIVAELDVPGLRAIDMDLDVIQRTDGTIELDDEDEFEAHRAAMGYPAELVARCRRAADDVTHRIRTSASPFDGRQATWLERLVASTP